MESSAERVRRFRDRHRARLEAERDLLAWIRDSSRTLGSELPKRCAELLPVAEGTELYSRADLLASASALATAAPGEAERRVQLAKAMGTLCAVSVAREDLSDPRSRRAWEEAASAVLLLTLQGIIEDALASLELPNRFLAR